ncbi:MAG: hypothetical protein Q9171_002911 [Xanthocarpia ochracea]
MPEVKDTSSGNDYRIPRLQQEVAKILDQVYALKSLPCTLFELLEEIIRLEHRITDFRREIDSEATLTVRQDSPTGLTSPSAGTPGQTSTNDDHARTEQEYEKIFKQFINYPTSEAEHQPTTNHQSPDTGGQAQDSQQQPEASTSIDTTGQGQGQGSYSDTASEKQSGVSTSIDTGGQEQGAHSDTASEIESKASTTINTGDQGLGLFTGRINRAQTEVPINPHENGSQGLESFTKGNSDAQTERPVTPFNIKDPKQGSQADTASETGSLFIGIAPLEGRKPQRHINLALNENASKLQALVAEAQNLFRTPGIELPTEEHIEQIKPTEIDSYFSQFLPDQWLATSAINPLISSFKWDVDTLVLHSSRIDINDTKDFKPPKTESTWPILEYHQQIILPSCYESHWTLFVISLSQRTVKRYNSLTTSSHIPEPLKAAIDWGIAPYYRGSLYELDFRNDVSVIFRLPNREAK